MEPLCLYMQRAGIVSEFIVILTQPLFFPSASRGQSLPSDWLLWEYVYVVPLPQVGTSSEAEFPFSILLLDHTEATLHKMLSESTYLFSFFLFPVPLPPFSNQSLSCVSCWEQLYMEVKLHVFAGRLQFRIVLWISGVMDSSTSFVLRAGSPHSY